MLLKFVTSSDLGYTHNELSARTPRFQIVKSTARPSCLVGVLYDIYGKTINRSTPNQPLFSERELMFMFAICRRPSVCLSSVVCRLSVVCNVRAPYSGD